jgi:hypothetical protein
LKIILEEKDRDVESLRCENARLVDHYRKVADDKENIFREEKLSLEKQIKPMIFASTIATLFT